MKAATWFVRFLVLLSVVGVAQFLFAQGTDLGTITGSVTDGSGAVVPNAKVVILDLATNTPHETRTNSQGVYRVFGLSSGQYQVSVSQTGMNTAQINGVQVRGSDVVTANAVLKVASATEVVSQVGGGAGQHGEPVGLAPEPEARVERQRCGVVQVDGARTAMSARRS